MGARTQTVAIVQTRPLHHELHLAGQIDRSLIRVIVEALECYYFYIEPPLPLIFRPVHAKKGDYRTRCEIESGPTS